MKLEIHEKEKERQLFPLHQFDLKKLLRFAGSTREESLPEFNILKRAGISKHVTTPDFIIALVFNFCECFMTVRVKTKNC